MKYLVTLLYSPILLLLLQFVVDVAWITFVHDMEEDDLLIVIGPAMNVIKDVSQFAIKTN